MAYDNDRSEFLGAMLRDLRRARKSRHERLEIDEKGEAKEPYRKWLVARDNCGYMPIHLAAQFGSNKAFRILWKACRNMEYHEPDFPSPGLQGILTKDGQFVTFFFSFL